MNIFPINVQEPYATFILNGVKTVEGRLNKGKFAEAQVGDQVLLNETTTFVIVGKNQYKTFKEMIESEGLKNVIPDVETVEQAVQVYYGFYTPEQEKEFEVVALKLQKAV